MTISEIPGNKANNPTQTSSSAPFDRQVLLGGTEAEQDLQDPGHHAQPPDAVDATGVDGGDDVQRAAEDEQQPQDRLRGGRCSCVGLDVLHDDGDLPVRTLHDRVPDGQAVRWKMETVGAWQRICLRKWVGKRGDWLFEEVKDCPVGGVPKWLRQSFKLVPGSVREAPVSGRGFRGLIRRQAGG
jgi:hypothetical protein